MQEDTHQYQRYQERISFYRDRESLNSIHSDTYILLIEAGILEIYFCLICNQSSVLPIDLQKEILPRDRLFTVCLSQSLIPYDGSVHDTGYGT